MTARTNDMSERPEATKAAADVLSEVLRAVRLRGAVFYTVKASTPWVAEAPLASEIAPHVMPGADHVIHYHLITAGQCYGGLIGEPAKALEAGDVIVFPHGDAHVMSSGEGMRGPVNIEGHAQAALARLPVRVDYGGTGRDPVSVVCGFLACDARPYNPLLAALPRVMVMKKNAAPGGMLDYFATCAVAETNTPRAGGEVMLARLSELMFVEVVRSYVAEMVPTQVGWLSGLRDEVVGRALAALHGKPAYAWSLEDLAREAATSRSLLAERFAELVGVPPMQYLAQWRMQLASSLLSGPRTLAQIADDVGYGSEAALSKAFKKIVGMSPAQWRASRAS